jgi:hypothetical protein
MASMHDESAPNSDRMHSREIDDRRKAPDRRLSSRRKILKSGKTFWPNGDSSECLVYNLSETGAQLEIRSPVPNVFDLLVEGDPWRRSCSVVWRKANRADVKFQEQFQLLASRKSLANQLSDCRRFAEMCQSMAERVNLPDRERLLEMAAAWLTVMRQLQRSGRLRNS